MGVPALDEMLGGGLPRGYSLLVAGPSGSGKSILAASFLAEGVRRRDRRRRRLRAAPEPVAQPALADLIASGQVGLIDSRQPDLSIDEIVLLMLDEMRRLKATPRGARLAQRLRARPGADLPRPTSASRCWRW
jgi:circadian clock protein KaiC